MNTRLSITVILLSLLISVPASGQINLPKELRTLTASPDEIISLSSTLPFNEAMDIFNQLSIKHLQKNLIDLTGKNEAIGINIDKLYWLDALELILRHKNLTYEMYRDHILVKPAEKVKPDEKVLSAKEMYESREVIISAIFFEANRDKLRQMGSSWTLSSDDAAITGDLSAAEGQPGLIKLNVLKDVDFGRLTALFQMLESKQTGNILASPQVTVRSGKEGRVQIGSDFSVTTRDFAGNTVTQFFSTGSIITVTPEVISVEGSTFINLDLIAQKSTANKGELGIEVKKTEARTSVLLLDGEETIIGGLNTNEENLKRDGIPILKDLPWWVFGLRYVFGFETKSFTKKELIMLLRAELVPTIEERIQARLNETQTKDVLKSSIEKNRERLQGYQAETEELIR